MVPTVLAVKNGSSALCDSDAQAPRHTGCSSVSKEGLGFRVE